MGSGSGTQFWQIYFGPKTSLFTFLGFARAVVGPISKIGFFDHLNFEKYEPGHLYVGESKPPQENGWWDEEKLVQEEKERAGAILTATRQLRTPRLMMMLSITTLTSVKALGTKRIQSCPYPFLPHKSPPPCDLPVTVETFPSQPQTRSVYRELLQ